VKFIRLIWSGIWRHPVRATLLLLQISAAFTLFGLLNGMSSALELATAKQRGDVLYVTGRVSGDSLPLSYAQKIHAIPEVLIVNPQNYLPAEYQSPTQPVVAVATSPSRYFAINTYCRVTPDSVRAIEKQRTAAIVGAELVRKFGWKVGDRVPLRSEFLQKDGSPTWTFDVVGIYEYPEEPDMANLLIVNNDYVDQSRADPPEGSVARFVVKISDAEQAPAVSDAIDMLFANSAHETATISESESAQVRLQSMGDLDLVARTVTAAAVFALLVSAGTLLMNSVRQRTPELAVLKALGFTHGTVTGLVICEVLFVFVVGAALGLGVAWRLLPLTREYAGLINMPGVVVLAGIASAIAVGLFCAWLPARHASKLQVVDALAGR